MIRDISHADSGCLHTYNAPRSSILPERRPTDNIKNPLTLPIQLYHNRDQKRCSRNNIQKRLLTRLRMEWNLSGKFECKSLYIVIIHLFCKTTQEFCLDRHHKRRNIWNLLSDLCSQALSELYPKPQNWIKNLEGGWWCMQKYVTRILTRLALYPTL